MAAMPVPVPARAQDRASPPTSGLAAPDPVLAPPQTPAAPALSQTAEGADEPPASYRTAADLGLEEFDAGNYPEAKVRFQEAHRIWPNARTLRALGYCEYELKNYVEAIRLMRESLSSQLRPLAADGRAEIEQVLERARAYVARYQIRTLPADARVLIDGLDVTREAGGGVLLSVGPHQLEVEATGHESRRRELAVQGQVDAVIQVELPTLSPARADLVDEPLRKKWWVWASAGAAVAVGVATGLAVGLHDPGERRASGGNTGIRINVGYRAP